MLIILEEMVEGKIWLKVLDGDIIFLIILMILEFIIIVFFSLEVVWFGDVIIIEGDYFNFIIFIFFSEEQEVLVENFISQEKIKIEVEVFVVVQSGSIVFFSIQFDLLMFILVEIEILLEVIILSGIDLVLNLVKVGMILIISGLDLDFVQ